MRYLNTIKGYVFCLVILTGGAQFAYSQEIPPKSEPSALRPGDSAVKRVAVPQLLGSYNGRAVDTNLVVETITDTVLVTLIDNGTIDGDTVTLVVNGRIAHAGVGLNDNLKYFWIGMVKGQRNQIIMYAENLGKMPPNTALMRVYHSGKTEWIYASSDYNKSFSLILQHRIISLSPFFGTNNTTTSEVTPTHAISTAAAQ